MIEVGVARLGLDSVSNSYVVILQEKGGQRLLPIWIGQAEAESIVMELNKVKPPRPLTHDLCKRLITGLGARLERVEITKVQENTYYAELHLELNGNAVHVDARPSTLRFSDCCAASGTAASIAHASARRALTAGTFRNPPGASSRDTPSAAPRSGRARV